MRVLCLCSEGANRSRVCANYLSSLGYETRYRGAREGAMNPLEEGDVKWADVIICTRPKHARMLMERFEVRKPIIILDISDVPKEIRESLSEENVRLVEEKILLPQIKKQISQWLPLEEYVKKWKKK